MRAIFFFFFDNCIGTGSQEILAAISFTQHVYFLMQTCIAFGALTFGLLNFCSLFLHFKLSYIYIDFDYILHLFSMDATKQR